VGLNQFSIRLQNKVIIITGSTTRIGKAIALRSVSEGAKVVIHGLEKELGESVISQLGHDNVVLHLEDIGNEGATDRLVDIAVRKFGKLDAIVNNAAAILSSNIETPLQP
jgi:NAD(P)-dependent dehydrogenase (short-subunit alcohol dehydrogenase family)